MWQDLTTLRSADPEAPIFRSRNGGGALRHVMVHYIVKKAAARAGLSAAVSAHWLRHAHVSHALDRAHLPTSFRQPSVTPISPPPANTPTRDQQTAVPAICPDDGDGGEAAEAI